MAPFCPMIQLREQRSQKPPRPDFSSSSVLHQFQCPKPRPRPPTIPTNFIQNVVGPLNKFKEARITADGLTKFRVTLTPMDFETGKVDSRCRKLLNLSCTREIETFTRKVQPWIGYDGLTCFDNFLPERYITDNPHPRNYHRTAQEFATILNVWATNSMYQTFKASLLGQTSWNEHSDAPAARWLGVPATDDYIWRPNFVYHNFKMKSSDCEPRAADPEKPHAMCYVVDSTPFLEDGSLRTSELKTIILIAVYNHVKPEYNHLDSFGVTAISFWDRDVRIVQGLVNFRTWDVDVRLTKVQRFHTGFRGADGSIDVRFLTLLAYNSADVLPLLKY
ncbi:hypothetical protein CCM_08352 [Cordyceps militaris CM01]|uniref:Uncharacterized protein n=1 Tax=Cordyceps militaris (strain CM01) TaxID=983644 RepID=G3JR13_CORMM|nr:uncharacterized protein CCM_08352 [Cordyceps militaris CM01]EGX88309.1 hypothetical protein CCM_08352 [Cordyceps militaris CM01]